MNMNIDLTPVLQALIGLLAAILTAKVIPWIEANCSDRKRRDLLTAARVAVSVAEQIYGSDKENNDRKLDYAINRLRENGFDLDVTALREAVEYAVYTVKWHGEGPWMIQAEPGEPEEPGETDTDPAGPDGD